MTLTKETADKCEKALKAAQWAADEGTHFQGHLNMYCPTCQRKPIQQHKPDCPIGVALAALRDETPEPPPPDTPEQKARKLFAATNWSSFTELADLIASHERLLTAIRSVAPLGVCQKLWWNEYGQPAIDNAWKPD